MQDFVKPLFQKGRVLKRESLEALRDFPAGLAKLGLSGWSDGILYGFDISYENGAVTISAGAVWHQAQIVLTQAETIPFYAYDQQITVCLRLYPGSYSEDFYVRQLELRLKNGGPGSNEIELGRFRLSKGARLRKDYQDLRDCRTTYNTLDLTQVPYAGPGGVTVSPVLLQVFARMVMENMQALDMDIQFALLCLGHLPVSRECLLWYICRRMHEPFRELTHSEIYEKLVRIAGAGGHGQGRQRQKDGPMVF